MDNGHSYTNWLKAKDSVPACSRCEEWGKMGLSSTCPDCDARIIEAYEKLMKEKS